MIAVDTNILVYAADADAPLHEPCRRWIEERRARPDAWYTTWPVVYEFLRVTTHPRVFRKPWTIGAAWAFVAALRAAPAFELLAPTDRHAEVLDSLVADFPHLAGNILHDAHTAVLLREHGVRQLCTRDTDFHRFPFIEVIDPAS
ncbi:PIN domain-containing protein [Candidatus Binatia bacterium]|nr:PIN domain-containing protein [Candidatus Binatia bacterium]